MGALCVKERGCCLCATKDQLEGAIVSKRKWKVSGIKLKRVNNQEKVASGKNSRLMAGHVRDEKCLDVWLHVVGRRGSRRERKNEKMERARTDQTGVGVDKEGVARYIWAGREREEAIEVEERRREKRIIDGPGLMLPRTTITLCALPTRRQKKRRPTDDAGLVSIRLYASGT